MSIGAALGTRETYEVILQRDALQPQGVTIVIPCYQQQEYLHDAMISALKQTVPPVEIIIVDDGSPTPIVVLDEPDDYPHIPVRVVRVTNRGLPSARNTGLMLTRSDAFLPLDADDWIEPTFIEKMYPLLRDADVVVPGLQEHGPTRNQAYMPGYDRPLDQVSLDVMWDFNRTFYCSLFRTELLKSVGGYNGRMTDGFEDYDLAIDLMTRGARYVGCYEYLFNYRTRPDSMLALAMSKQHIIKAEMRRHHNMM